MPYHLCMPECQNDRLCDFVVATGRFQLPMHTGHLEYLRAANQHAATVKAPFHVLTGPRDDQLGHGELTFAERRAVISVLAEIDQEQVHNQYGGPHGVRSVMQAWVRNFFADLFEPAHNCNPHKVDLVVVRKKEDIKHYSGQPNAVHYSTLLLESGQNVELQLVDVTGQMTQPGLSSSALKSCDSGFLTPAVSVAAKLLKDAKVPAGEWSNRLLPVRSEFQETLISWDDISVHSRLREVMSMDAD